jgi:hypothetical protein
MEGVGAALVKAVSRNGCGSRPATYIEYRSRGPTITVPVHRREEQVQRYNGKAGRPVLPSLRSKMGDVSHVRPARQKQPSSLIACRAYYRFLPKSEPFTAMGIADPLRSRGRSEVTLCRTHGMILAVGHHGRHLINAPPPLVRHPITAENVPMLSRAGPFCWHLRLSVDRERRLAAIANAAADFVQPQIPFALRQPRLTISLYAHGLRLLCGVAWCHG